MANDYQTLLNQYMAADPLTNPDGFDTTNMPQTKAAQVAATSAQKLAQMGPDGYKLAAMQATGSGVAGANQIDHDFATMTPFDFRQKYGDQIGQQYSNAYSSGDASRRNDTQGRRSTYDAATDLANSTTTGLVNSLAGIGELTLAADPVSHVTSAIARAAGFNNFADKVDNFRNAAVVKTSRAVTDFNQLMQDNQSDDMQGARRAYSNQQALDSSDNAANYIANAAKYGPTLAGAYRIGADAVDAAGNVLSSPEMVGDTVGSGIGSILAAGPVGEGIGALGSATVGRLGVSDAIAAATQRAAAGRYLGLGDNLLIKAGEEAPTMAAISAMEGGGAVQQTADQASRQLDNRTDLTQDQKNKMAADAGLEAGLVQGTAAAALSPLVAKFEAHPTGAATVREALQNVAKEGIEETIQSGTGQAAQNLGIQQNVDPNQSLLEGVGEQAALGGIGGLGSAGAIQTPSIALHTAVNTAKLPFKAAGAVLSAAGDQVQAANQRVKDALMSGLNGQAVQAIPEATTQANDTIDNSDKSDAFKQKAKDWVNQNITRLQNVQGIQDTAKTVLQKGGSVLDKLRAASTLNQQVDDSREAQNQDTPEGLQDSTVQKIKDVVANVAQSDTVQDALAHAKTLASRAVSAINQRTSNPQSITQDDADALVSTAQSVPEKVDPKSIDNVLYHDAQGNITLTPQQRSVLRTASATAKGIQQGSELASQYGLANADKVATQVLTNVPEEGSKLSLQGHLDGIRSAYNSGDLDLASQRLGDLRSFAQSQSNKVSAFNEALAGGNTSSHNPVSYSAHIGNGKFRPSETGVHLSPTSANSVKLAQHVAVEAATLASTVNSMADAFPDLGVKHINPTTLDPALNGDARTVASEYQSGKRQVPSNEVESAPTKTEAPVENTNVDLEPEKETLPEPTVQEETKPKNQEETVTSEPTQEASHPMDEHFPGLVGSEANRLKVAFNIPEQKTTRTFGVESPVQTVKDALKNETTFRETIDGDLNRKFTPEIAKSYSEYLSLADDLMKIMNQRLSAFLNKDAVKKADMSKAVGWLNGGALNIVNEQNQYDPKLLQNAVLGALQWYLKLNQYGSNLEPDDVRAMLRLDPSTPVNFDLVNRINQGLGSTEISRSLSSEISKFWGFTQNRNAPENFANGVLEGVAKELLESMISRGMLQEIKVDISDVTTDENIKEVNRYRPWAINEKGEEVPVVDPEDPLRQFPTAIEKAVLLQPEELNYIGQPPKTVAKTQLRNDHVETTDQQRTVIKAEQDIPHYLNLPFINMLKRMGEDQILNLFGGGDLDTRPLNQNHKKSLEGQNLTIQSAFRSILSLHAETENAAEVLGSNLEDTPVHFAYNYTVVNRLQMLGRDNPQSNKLMREAVLPTWKTMDLTNPDTRTKFNMGLAQALGVKVHQVSSEVAMKQLQQKLEGFTETLSILRENSNLSLTPTEVRAMKSEGVDTAVALHALMEYARIQNTRDLTNFKSAIYFEADGVTNGVVNAMSLFTPGQFKPSWISNIEKGGLYLGSDPMSLAQLRTRDTPGADLDLYGTAAQNTAKRFKDLRAEYGQTEVRNQMDAVGNLLNEFFKGVEYDDSNGDVTIDRGATKNPLTITVYGSGANGIAGNILDDVTSKIYEQFSEAAARKKADPKITDAQAFYGGDEQTAQEKFEKLQTTMNALVSKVIASNKGELHLETTDARRALSGEDFTNFTFNPNAMKAMQQNLLHAFVNPMVGGITDTVGSDLIDSMELIKTQVQSWSLVGKYAYQNAYEQALQAKRKANPDMPSNELLSRAESDAILKKVMNDIPHFGTGTQNFMFGLNQQMDLPFMTSKSGKALKLEFSRSLTDGFDTQAYGYMPSDAGVAGQPGLTIGSGDGQAIQNMITNPDIPKERLQIFDGIHSSAADMDTMGQVANKGVWDSWTRNPFEDLTKAYNQFADQTDLSNLTEDQRQELTKSLFNEFRVARSAEDILAGMKRLGSISAQRAESINERQKVLARVQLSVDQMAGAATPHTREGIILTGTVNEKAAQLNRLLAQKAPQRAKEVEPTQTAEKPVEASEALQSVPVTTLNGLTERAINKLTDDRLTRALLKDVTRSGRVQDYTIKTGSRDTLLQEASDQGISIPPERQNTFMGFMDPNSKQLFIVDGNPETMLHELIHAATYETLQAHYNGQDVGLEAKDAIARLEGLMSEFKEANLEGKAYQDALDEMEQQANAGNQAGELNEFMAWGLANADLQNQLKDTKIDNKIIRMGRAIVKTLKSLLWGGKRSAAVKDDIFTNLRFNTNILMRSNPTTAEFLGDSILYHDPSFGENDRITDLMGQIKSKLTDYAGTNPVQAVVNKGRATQSLVNAARVSKAFSEAGFNMDKQTQMAFMHMIAIMGTDAQLDPNSLSRLQDMYTHALSQLSVDDFLRNPGEDDVADTNQAQRKFSLLTGKFASRTDALNRSTILPAFAALAVTNDEFRAILGKMDMPKGKYEAWNSVDNIFDNLGSMAIDNMSRAVSGEGLGSKNVKDAIDGMINQMLETQADSQMYIEKFTNPIGDAIDKANDIVVGAFTKLGEVSQRNLDNLRTNKPDAKIQQAIAASVNSLVGLLHEPTGHRAAIDLMSAMNRSTIMPQMVFDLFKDMIGRTEENQNVYDMIKTSRAWVNGIRQQYVEQLPKIINGKFDRTLTDEEQTHMHKGLAQTDMASLLDGNKIDDVLDLISNVSKRAEEIRRLKTAINNLSPSNGNLIEAKSQQLADYISKGIPGSNLLRNAEAIAHLLGENVGAPVTSKDMIQHIDHLVSLLALEGQQVETKSVLSSLAQNQKEGMNFVLNSLKGMRDIDAAKAEGNSRFNNYKGFMNQNQKEGISLVVAHDSDAPALLERSYIRMGALQASEKDPTGKNRSYWLAPVSGKAPFSQGIMQNIHQTVNGVDRASGYTNGLTGGIINDPNLVTRISKSQTKESADRALQPLYDENGQVYAYERSIEPRMLDHLQRDTNLANMMGIRAGRQTEEATSGKINKMLIDNLRDMYESDKKSNRTNEYINLSETKDPVYQYSMKIMNREVKDYITKRFPEGFLVRKDMVDDAVGYPAASIGDAWTGTSRWSPEVQESIKKMLMGVFGNKAYGYSVRAEKFLQNAIVQDIKTMIVVRSVIVPLGNAASNIYQLIGRGVPSVQIFKNIPKKTAEIESWHNTRIRQIAAEAELLATTDPIEQRKLQAEIKTITDSHKRLSIWPLLEAGEFSSISEAGDRHDTLLVQGKLSEYIEGLVDKLPPAVRTAGKYAIISKDTALFRGLQKTVDYGDFIAKSILYDDLTKRQGNTKAEALAKISEEFVNYDRLPGRDRQYLESIGMLWFWNFKVRSAKVAMSMIRNNPVHALISSNLPMPLNGMGLPIKDNLWMSLFDGRLANSVGLHMAFRAPGLLPLGNLFH